MSYDKQKAAAKAKRTRAKNKAKAAKDAEKLARANRSAANARNKLKYFREGFEEGRKIRD